MMKDTTAARGLASMRRHPVDEPPEPTRPERKDEPPPVKIEPMDVATSIMTEPPELDFVLPGFLLGTIGMLVAAGSTGKSMLALQTALTVGTGYDVWEIWGERLGYRPEGGLQRLFRPGRVAYLAVEDPAEVLHHRLHAVAGSWLGDNPYKHEWADYIAQQVQVLPLFGQGFSVAVPGECGPEASPWYEPLKKHLLELAPRLVIIDTLNRSLGGLDENSNGDMGALLAILERLAREVGAAVLVLHHTSKAAALGGLGLSQQASRGASALTDNCRWQLNLQTMAPDDAQKRGMTDAERRQWVCLDFSKINYAAPQPQRWLRRGCNGVLDAFHEPPAAVPRVNGKRRRDVAGMED